MSEYSREDKLYILAQVCKQNNLTPNSPAYMGLIIRVCTSKFSLSIQAAKEHAETLSAAYRADQWQTITTQNEATTTETESNTATANITEQRVSIQPELTLLAQNSHPKPPKKMQPLQATQKESWTPNELARIFHQMAKNDTDLNNVGRLILSECRSETDNKHLQAHEIMQLRQKQYPLIEIEAKSSTILLIYWDGKEYTHRHKPAPVMPERNCFKSDKYDGATPTLEDDYSNPEEYMGGDKVSVPECSEDTPSDASD